MPCKPIPLSVNPKAAAPKATQPLRSFVIGVRVSASERATVCERANTMHMKPAEWLRTAALSRRLPRPPVAAINRAQYVELARLSANLNQLTRLANEGQTSPSLAACWNGCYQRRSVYA
jgi:hypothetical protein